MSTLVESISDDAPFTAASRHIRVMSSRDRTATGRLWPRLMRDVDDLKAFVQTVPFFPRKRREGGRGSTRMASPLPIATGTDRNSDVGSSVVEWCWDAPVLLETAGNSVSSGAAAATSASLTAAAVGLRSMVPREQRGNEWAEQLEQQQQQQHEQEQQPFLWIDVKKPTRPERKEVLSWFPLHAITLEKLSLWGQGNEDEDEDGDRLEYFPAQGYLFLSLTGTPTGRSEDCPATVVFALFEHVLLTMSDGSYEGEEDVAISAIEAIHESDSAGISTIFSAIVSSLVLQTQGSVAGLMIDVDQLDELVLQIQPSEMDQNDMLTRIREMRHRVAAVHISLLLKERVLKQLLLPTLRRTTANRDPGCEERYQRSLTLARGSVERLRKARDTVNLSCMNLVSGVSARLVMHCHWMDYLNHVQAQISLVVMPVAVIPGLWASNVSVPWQGTETTKAFWGIVTVTLSLLALGMIYPIRKYFRYKPPGALVPTLD